MTADRRRLVLATALVAVAAFAARAPGAVTYPLWQDEVASARILAEPSFADAVRRVTETESTPPVWYVLGWVGHRGGVPVEDVRWLSVAFGAAAAALTLLFARRFLSLPAATASGLVVALAWQLVERGHELRAYSLYLLLSVAFAFLLAATVRFPTGRRLVALAAVTALGLLTHYFFALPVATAAAWLWASRRDARVRVGIALGVGVLPLLAWLPGFLEQVRNGRYDWVAHFDPLRAGAVYSTFFWNAGELYVEAQHVSVPVLEAVPRIAILLAVLAGASALWRHGPEARLAALLATVPVALAAVLWAAGGSVFTTRNLVCSAPFAAVALGTLGDALPRRAALGAATAALGLLALGLVQERTLRPPPYPEYAAQLLTAGWKPAEPVYIVGTPAGLSYYGTSYAFRSPIGWYLPGHPELKAADPPTVCGPFRIVIGSLGSPPAPPPAGCEPGRGPAVPPGGYWFRAG